MLFDQKNTVCRGLEIPEAVPLLPLCLSGGDQMMSQCIIKDSLGDASRHHHGKGLNSYTEDRLPPATAMTHRYLCSQHFM